MGSLLTVLVLVLKLVYMAKQVGEEASGMIEDNVREALACCLWFDLIWF